MTKKKLGWQLLGLAFLTVGFLPVTRVPVIGDDFYVMYQAQGMSNGDIFSWIPQAWGWGLQAGHFNPLGQALGGIYHFLSTPIASALNISPSHYYRVGAFTLILLSVIAATYFFVQTLKTLNVEHDAFTSARYFCLIAAITGVTVQVHPWSNDPVTTYSMAGFGSAAIGFLLLGLAMKSIRPNTQPVLMTIKVSFVAIFSVIYYELLVAAVAGAALIFSAGLFRKVAITEVSRKRMIFLLGFGVVLPGILFLGGRLYVSFISGTQGYTGTVFGGPIEGARTFIFALISSIPGGAWPFSFSQVNPMNLSLTALFAGTAIFVLIVLFGLSWFRTLTLDQIQLPRKIWIPFLSLIVFWWLSTAAQAMTAKYISEISSPGLVYLFYSIGMLSVALIIAGLVITIPRNRFLTLGMILLTSAVWFGTNQQTINWSLSTQMEAAYRQNSELSAALTNTRIDEAQRCQRLQNWLEVSWPEYYRKGVISNIEPAYQSLKGEEFCSDNHISTNIDVK